MKKLLLLLFAVLVASVADTYYAKLEPVEIYKIKSQVSGAVTKSDISLEGSFIKSRVVVKIDDKTDKKNLETSLKKLEILNNLLEVNKQNLKNAKQSYKIKLQNYNRIKNLKTKSKFEKDNQLLLVISASNQLLNAKQALFNLKSQIDDLEYKIFLLKDTISKKSILVKDGYLYKLYAKKGDFVAPGTPLMDVADTSKAKATIYISYDDFKNLGKKELYIDGKKSNANIKVWKIADTTNISSYKAEIILPKPKIFSKVVKIELK